MRQIKPHSPNSLCAGFALCCVNPCPHPSLIPAPPKAHSVLIIFLGEKQVNIISGACSAYHHVWKYFFVMTCIGFLTLNTYLLKKASPHLARFYPGLRSIQACQVLCKVLVGAVFLAPSYQVHFQVAGYSSCSYLICFGKIPDLSYSDSFFFALYSLNPAPTSFTMSIPAFSPILFSQSYYIFLSQSIIERLEELDWIG